MENAGFDARSIANYLLDIAPKFKLPLTNLQLQKIIFFAHGNYFQRFGCGLVLNQFEAWDHGPVVAELYHALKQFRDKPITGRAMRFDLETQSFLTITYDIFPVSVRNHLEEMLLFYGAMPPWELVKLSHAPEGPWYKTRMNAEKQVNFSMVIDGEMIRRFFLSSRIDSLQ